MTNENKKQDANINVYKKKLVIDNDHNEYIGFPESVDLNDIVYIKIKFAVLPSGRLSSKNDYGCIFCSENCPEKIGNMCSAYKHGMACPKAKEIHVKDFKKNSSNYKWLTERIQMMKYLIVFGELSAWAYENKDFYVSEKLGLDAINMFDANPSTKFENITDMKTTKEQVEKKIRESGAGKLPCLRNIYDISILRAVYYSYINYFDNYNDLCSATAFVPENEKKLYKLQIETVGMNYEHINKYVHKTNEYYLFDPAFNTYANNEDESIFHLNDYIHAIKTGDGLYSTIYIKQEDIVEAAESIKTNSIIYFFRFNELNCKLLEKIIQHLAETAKTE